MVARRGVEGLVVVHKRAENANIELRRIKIKSGMAEFFWGGKQNDKQKILQKSQTEKRGGKVSAKSTTCFSRNGTPLSEYPNEYVAQESADFENSRGQNLHFVPYECFKCGKWHIRPQSLFIRRTETTCNCSDSSGRSKAAYPTEDEAQKVAALRRKSGVWMRVYECPEGNGWHLTSHSY